MAEVLSLQNTELLHYLNQLVIIKKLFIVVLEWRDGVTGVTIEDVPVLTAEIGLLNVVLRAVKEL